MLKVRLHKGVGLKGADMNGKSDPYVIVSSGKQEKKSRIVKKTLDPVWNEEMEFTGTLQEFLSHGLMLKVFDYDSPLKLSKHDPLGDVNVTLDVLKWDDTHEYEEELPTQGSIQFGVSWTPMPAHMLSHGVRVATARWLHHVQPHVSYILGPESCSSTFLTVDDSERSDAFGWKFIDPDGPNREGTGSGACAQPEPRARPFAQSGATWSRQFCNRREKRTKTFR